MKGHVLRLLKKRIAKATDKKPSRRRSVAHKLMVMALSISLVTIVLATGVCLYALKKVQNTAIRDSMDFGDSAALKSKTALLMSYAEFMDNKVADKANISTEKFYSYMEDIEYMSVYVGEIMAHPEKYNKRHVFWDDKLPEGFDSVFMSLCSENIDYEELLPKAEL